MDEQMSCKVCGIVMSYDFSVPNLFWERVVPEHLQKRAVCAGCFHAFALAKGIARWEGDILE